MILSYPLVRLYKLKISTIRKFVFKLVYRLEGGEFYSKALRTILKLYHGVEIGMYSHGGCFKPYSFGKNTKFGRFCSIAQSAFGATLNHPMNRKSMHGFFFNPNLGYCKEERQYSPLSIGNDVWMGHNSIIMPSVNTIGDGAVIGAGAVVFKDIPPYAVVVGNPGRVVRYRFSPEIIERLLSEKWWEKSIDELKASGLEEYTRTYEEKNESDKAWG